MDVLITLYMRAFPPPPLVISTIHSPLDDDDVPPEWKGDACSHASPTRATRAPYNEQTRLLIIIIVQRNFERRRRRVYRAGKSRRATCSGSYNRVYGLYLM